ncbi:MAG: site-2 protease family protein [Burkholderiaceae bacterium]
MKFLAALLLAGKLGKVLTTGGTMLVSVFVYAFIYGWRYAVGFVALLFVHEMGHFVAARQRGLAVGAPVFIPFVGAWVALKTTEMDPETEAFVGLAGPMLGSAAAFMCYLLALENGERLLMAIAYGGFFLNLFNLIPLTPLDGGRIVGVISPKLWLVGVPVLGAVFLWKPSPLLLIIAMLAAPQVWAALTGRAQATRVVASSAVRFKYGVQYLTLAAGLAVLAFDAHSRLDP